MFLRCVGKIVVIFKVSMLIMKERQRTRPINKLKKSW